MALYNRNISKITLKSKSILVLIAILICAGVFLSHNIGKPFVGHHDWNGAFWGGIARNYLGNIYNVIGDSRKDTFDYATRGEFVYNYHYPPLLPVFFTISSFFLGLNETSLRLVSVFFSLVMVIYIYKTGSFLYSKNTGLLAAALTVVTPIFIYFGKLPDHEPVITSLCIVSFYYYLAIDKRYRNRILFFFFLTLALLEGWGAFFLLAFLIIHSLSLGKKKRFFTSLLVVLGILITLFHIGSIYIYAGEDALIAFFRHGLFRMNLDNSTSNIIHFGIREYIVKESRYIVIYFTRILLALSFIWLTSLLLKCIRRKKVPDLPLLLLLLYGLAYILVFGNLAYIHDYKIYLMLPYVALSSASVVVTFLGEIAKRVNKKYLYIWDYLKIILIILLILGVASERLPYLKTILASSFDKPGYELGNMIKYKTLPPDRIFLSSSEFDSFYGVYARFYSNRKIVSEDLTLKDFQTESFSNEYDYIILVDERPVDKNLQPYLMNKYSFEKIDKYLFFDLHADPKRQPIR